MIMLQCSNICVRIGTPVYLQVYQLIGVLSDTKNITLKNENDIVNSKPLLYKL